MARLILSNKDIQILTGKGRTAAQNLISAIKRKIQKAKYHQLTVTEFCEYMGLNVEMVLANIK